MTIIELGTPGELAGAIAVVLSLIYLATQIRQNTRSLKESHRVMLAQTYQARAEAVSQRSREMAESDHIIVIQQKLDDAGYANDLAAIETLSPLERRRWGAWHRSSHSELDNLVYQYQNGFVDEEYYETSACHSIRNWAPRWHLFGFRDAARPSFFAEVDSILAKAAQDPS